MSDTNVTNLHYQGKEIILIATAHVSKESVLLVKQVIEDEKPDSVCIELDEGRYQNIQNPQAWENTDIVKVIKSNRVGFLLVNLVLSSYQKRIAKQLGSAVQQLSVWVLWTGIWAAGFTALSLGHPLSILTSFITAPFTTIHPLLACGWFTGIVEASLKKPTVQDVHNILTDIFSFKGFFRNRFLKILLVVLMANIGASIGTLIAGTNLIKNLL